MDSVASAVRCSRCGRPAAEDDYVCSLCGELLRRPERPLPRVELAPAPAQRAVAFPAARPASGWTYLAIGLALAPVLTFTPMLRYVGWFATSLFHESGHAAVGWALGCPTIPTVGIQGEAAAVHQGQVPFLCVFWMACLAALAVKDRRRRVLWAAALAVYPVLAFTGAREALFLAGGHLGELAFAATFLVQALAGGFTREPAERSAHAMLGFYLAGQSVALSAGLAWSDQARATYASNGSFGLENDLVRLSRDVLGAPLPVVAFAMLLLAVATVAVALPLGFSAAKADAG